MSGRTLLLEPLRLRRAHISYTLLVGGVICSGFRRPSGPPADLGLNSPVWDCVNDRFFFLLVLAQRDR